EKLSQKIAHIYATDGWESYNLTDPAKHVIGKAHTFTVERTILFCVIILLVLQENSTLFQNLFQ
ncbi:MAG: hypothetical protein LBP36_02190, partial [Oscillospiraceae bacterium]|nr:hypothetical protein [Oscillospiraceae bacterium]